jgi:hypothetical protein
MQLHPVYVCCDLWLYSLGRAPKLQASTLTFNTTVHSSLLQRALIRTPQFNLFIYAIIYYKQPTHLIFIFQTLFQHLDDITWIGWRQ